ncbi:uncharacterized protein NECHADRAFT_97740 [Fusarium vanettenii 77-13-4]|uniref:Heterokaryon incompatibility domain-containing protein n=1 Tax=Fusarium vanettenii (strain ATCC MYA-4622 / CBS 123669 / FGSC 9596 / NRRL 45880 / 77-13-4) TaxID=660122 RepID=C7Z2J2_FUSV7|nr:uncharacterized protein NECHADRAFT_97740 [Fusarium vanettenii 77-13-4]EEU41672.1 hypothetical protein NECHADRAFT_97740 [Fusarium vanettenii 77-13-4]
MSRCTFCRAFTISVERHYQEFHPDLVSLKRSAEDGCDFCLLCWTGFQQEWTTSQIESVLKDKAPEGVSEFEPSIWIYTQPQISVYCGRVSPLPGQRESSFGLNHINLSVYGEEGTLAGSRTPGRICTAEHRPDTYITITQQFLQGCIKFHRACDFKGTYRMPTRVIDPQHGRQIPRPILLLGPATDTYTLNANTMEDMLNGMDESRLVAAHRDTLSLARSLGIQFVWIDALCIIQGNKEDWERESKLMARVYGSSTLTVSAGRSADARNSFIINDYKQPAPCCEIPLDEGQGNVLVGLRRSSDYGVVETRGWCLQEKKWSRRIVFFGKEQLYFLCRCCSYSEDRNYEEEKPSSLHAILSQADKDMSSKRDRLLQFWDGVLIDFSKRQLSNPHDIFAATASIAEPVSRAIGSRYLAGLWECDLVRCLLWRPGYLVSSPFFGSATRPRPTRFAPAPVIRAPSWSWASIQGGIYPLSKQTLQGKIKQYQGEDFFKAKPKLRNPDRWTTDTHCDANILHMPSCELQLVGRIQEAFIITKTPADDFVDTLRRQKKPGPGMLRQKTLLGRKELKEGAFSSDLALFVALGAFDLAEESVQEVWCLQLTAEEGLMLRKGDNGRFQRLGLFQLYKMDWFGNLGDSEVVLV